MRTHVIDPLDRCELMCLIRSQSHVGPSNGTHRIIDRSFRCSFRWHSPLHRPLLPMGYSASARGKELFLLPHLPPRRLPESRSSTPPSCYVTELMGNRHCRFEELNPSASPIHHFKWTVSNGLASHNGTMFVYKLLPDGYWAGGHPPPAIRNWFLVISPPFPPHPLFIFTTLSLFACCNSLHPFLGSLLEASITFIRQYDRAFAIAIAISGSLGRPFIPTTHRHCRSSSHSEHSPISYAV